MQNGTHDFSRAVNESDTYCKKTLFMLCKVKLKYFISSLFHLKGGVLFSTYEK